MKRCFLLLLLVVMLSGCASSIGTVTGPEWDVITIDGIAYIKATQAYDIYSSADKDTYLGIVKSGDKNLHIYTLKGDTEQNYLYVRWEWEGELYVRSDCADAQIAG
ncbi:MAG: hypothetical protein IJX37_07230 [Oscillospiraceae bacterium]|nr:hypothetical protein [Oscillospiraceae bacterium]